jgi:HAD superfamily hydrolase (TIGR01509 family)
MPPALVIFDCDGVLVDSERISLAVMRAVLADLGCVLDEAEGYAHLLGRSLPSVAAWLRRSRGLDLSSEHVAELRRRLFDRLRAELVPLPGVEGVVEHLPMPVCVASSSQPDRIRLTLRVTGLLDLFEPHVFSAAEVARGKPAPDLFLHAARSMGVPPADCVVVEDSPAGLAAAAAAGMRAVAFLGGSHAGPARLAEAVAVFPVIATLHSMADLPAALAAA